MHRIDTDGTVASLPTPGAAGSLVGYFSDGEAISGTPGTVIGASWLNAVQEEILAVLSEGGLSPDKSTNDQLRDAIIAIIEERSIDSAISGVSNKLLRTDGSARTPVVSTSVELDSSDNLGGVSTLAVGVSSALKAGSAILEASSTTQGFLPPRMTETERNGIAAPAEGLVVYNTTKKRHDFHNGLSWGAMSGAAVPVGGIIAFSGGYFTNALNGGFTDMIGNSAAAVNAALNGAGWYVCDGAALHLAGSPIFNGPGRYLPNLSDARFLMGSTAAGSIGGQNSVTLLTANLPAHTHTINHTHADHYHENDHDHGATSTGAHTHGVYQDNSSNTNDAFQWNTNNRGSTLQTDSETPSINLAAYAGLTSSPVNSSGTAIDITFSGSSGSTGSATAYENRPLYLSVLYLQRAI